MVRITGEVSNDLEQKFRQIVYRKFGMKHGNISKAVEEALKDWINKNEPLLEESLDVGVKTTG